MTEPTVNSDGTQTVLCVEIRSGIDGCCNVDCGELTVAAPHGTKAEDLQDVARWRLTGREASILALFRDGKTNNEIAAKLEVSRATVKWHVHNLFAKTGAFSREELLRLALRYDAPPSEDDEPGDDAPASARPAKAWF